MVKKNVWLGILGITLVLGMALAGCDKGSANSNGTNRSSAKNPLNGTWIGTGDDGGEYEMKLDNGNVEMSSGGQSIKGTYTTDGGKITMKITHIHGDMLAEMGMELASDWYSKDQLKAAFMALGVSEKDFNEWFDELFTEQTTDYSVNGNTLTMKDSDGKETKYSKK